MKIHTFFFYPNSLISMNGNGLHSNGGPPYTNGAYDPQPNQQVLGYGGGGGGGLDLNATVGEFKYPHIQLRDVSYEVRREGVACGGRWETVLNSITMEARGGEILALLSTKGMNESAMHTILHITTSYY